MREANHELWRIERSKRRSEGETETGGREFVGYVLLLQENGGRGDVCRREGETRKKEEWATLEEAMAGLVVGLR